ncbi:unnamed protein product [Scytosiphon promiscuus]
MRTHTRAIAPALPLVYALRLSWADPKVFSFGLGHLSRRALSFAVPKGPTTAVFPSHGEVARPQPSSGLRLRPWAHALPLDVPVPQRRSPRVLESMRKDGGRDFPSGVSASLWEDCQLEALRSLHHPWTLGLATGKTTRASFKKYVAQDAYFLRAFAKAYAYALIKAEDEKGVRAFHSLIGSVLEELGLHASYSLKWGVDVKNTPPPVKATAEYVDFLLAVASDPTSSVAQVLAAMAPCMRLYAFLGKALRGGFPNWKDSTYAEWIETYSSEDFENAAGLVESLLDEYSKEADYASLLPLYRQAMELEFAFFDAQADEGIEDDGQRETTSAGSGVRQSASDRSGEENVRDRGHFRGVHQWVSLFCVDFDDTVTDGDTTSLLVETAKAESPGDRAAIELEWERLTGAFFSEWGEVSEECLTTKRKGDVCTTESAETVDREGLEDMLRKLEAVDLDSVSRVSDSKILRGLTRESVHSSLAGPLRSSWKVRPGMARCMNHALLSSLQTHVVSINWSRDVITQVLSETVLTNQSSSDSSAEVNLDDPSAPGETTHRHSEEEQPVSVFSNDLVYDEHGVSTGEIDVKVSGSFGKHQRFLSLAARAREAASISSETTSPSKAKTIYVGDSVTDLLAMLDADVGIVVGTSGTFEQVASAFGIAIRPLASAYEVFDDAGDSSSRAASRDPGQCVYRASHWAEIDVFLFGG